MGRLESASCLVQCNFIGFLECCQNILENARVTVFPKRGEDGRLHCTGPMYKSLQDKVCIVTGANAGIGLETSKMLVARGAHLIIACRSQQKGMAAARVLEEVEVGPLHTKGKIEFMPLDLAVPSSVHQFAQAFHDKNLQLGLLICNAGIMAPPQRCVAENNVELQFQVNHLGHWLLAHELLKGQLARQSKAGHSAAGHRAPEASPRVVFLSSLTHWGGRQAFSDVSAQRSYHPLLTYGDSKLGNVLTVKELQRRFNRNEITSKQGYTAVAVHPGLLYTDLACTWMENNFPSLLRPAATHMLRNWGLHKWWTLPATNGADAVLYAATAPDHEVAGRYLGHGKPGWQAPKAEKAELSKKLWDLSCHLTGSETTQNLL